MRYRIEYRGPCYECFHNKPEIETVPERWVLEKVMSDGDNDAYLVASYREHGPAVAALSLMASSLEVEEWNGSVEFDGFEVGAAT